MNTKVHAAGLTTARDVAARHRKLPWLQATDVTEGLFDVTTKLVERNGLCGKPNHAVVEKRERSFAAIRPLRGTLTAMQLPPAGSVGIGAREAED